MDLFSARLMQQNEIAKEIHVGVDRLEGELTHLRTSLPLDIGPLIHADQGCAGAVLSLCSTHVSKLNQLLCPVKTGYPPKLLVIDDTTAHSSLESLGITNGEQILTSERPAGAAPTFNFASQQQAHQAPTHATSTSVVSPPSLASGSTTTSTTSSNAFVTARKAEDYGFGPGMGARVASQARTPIGSAIGGSPSVNLSHDPAPVEVESPSVTPSNAIESIRIRDEGFLVVRVCRFSRAIQDETRRAVANTMCNLTIGSSRRQQLPI